MVLLFRQLTNGLGARLGKVVLAAPRARRPRAASSDRTCNQRARVELERARVELERAPLGRERARLGLGRLDGYGMARACIDSNRGRVGVSPADRIQRGPAARWQMSKGIGGYR